MPKQLIELSLVGIKLLSKTSLHCVNPEQQHTLMEIINVASRTNYAIKPLQTVITLFRFTTMLCGTDNILWNILYIHTECGE